MIDELTVALNVKDEFEDRIWNFHNKVHTVNPRGLLRCVDEFGYLLNTVPSIQELPKILSTIKIIEDKTSVKFDYSQFSS